MTDVYCPICDRGYTEEINRQKQLEGILNEFYDEFTELKVYKCNDCGYEFLGSKKEKDIIYFLK